MRAGELHRPIHRSRRTSRVHGRCIISAYFHHTGYSCHQVQKVYDALDTLIKEAKAEKKDIVLAADSNEETSMPQ
eukprot:10535064-Karenia_brevis.AAC.1